MMKNIFILWFFCAILSGVGFCQNEIEIDSQVISINPDSEYIIIKAGENDGVEIGDGLIVHRNAEKLAEAQIVEVRPDVAAAVILNIEKEQKKEFIEKTVEKDKEIKEGDSILIVKELKESSAEITAEGRKIEERKYREQKKSKWTTLLGSKATAGSAVPVDTVDSSYPASGYMANVKTPSEALHPEKIQVMQESSVVRASIETDFSAVFSYALMVLREDGYSVIFSNRVTGNILATMPIELTLMKELWADAIASIEHKLVVSLEMKYTSGATELKVSSFKEHTQKGKQIKLPVTRTDPRDSKYYSALVELASKIKERAEH